LGRKNRSTHSFWKAPYREHFISKQVITRLCRLTHFTLLLLLIFTSFVFAEAAQTQELRALRVQPATFTQQRASVTYSGTVIPRILADIAFRVGGKIVARPVNVGDHVVPQQVLAQLDPSDLQLEVAISGNAVAAAEAEAANARAFFSRYDKLGRASSAFVESEYDSRRAAMRSADARLERTRQQQDMARNQRQYATLRADADGVITALPAELGQIVAAGQTVAVLAHGADTEIVVRVPENRLDEVRAAQTVLVILWSAPGRSFQGRVREMGALADSVSRTFAVKVALANPADDHPAQPYFALGMTVTAQFIGPPGPSVIILPASAITAAGGESAVWVLDDTQHRAVLTPVHVVAFGGDGTVLIGAGLSEGQLVVTAGADLIDRDLPVTAWHGPTR